MSLPPYPAWHFERNAPFHYFGCFFTGVAAAGIMVSSGEFSHVPGIVGCCALLFLARKCLARMKDQAQARLYFVCAFALMSLLGAWSGAGCPGCDTPVALMMYMSGNLLLFPLAAFLLSTGPMPRWLFLFVLAANIPAHLAVLQKIEALESTLGDEWQGLASLALNLWVLEYGASIAIFVWLDGHALALYTQFVEAVALGQSRERYIASLSHDFGTPCTAVQIGLQQLLDGALVKL